MGLCHFAAGPNGRLFAVRPGAVRGLLAGDLGAAAFGDHGGREVRLVTVERDGALLPTAVYLVRVPLTDGRFAEDGYLLLRALADPTLVTPAEAERHHRSGWPADLVRQLAVALDVPVAGLAVPFAAGGPVLAAALGDRPPAGYDRAKRSGGGR
jgi:hypothetical protein